MPRDEHHYFRVVFYMQQPIHISFLPMASPVHSVDELVAAWVDWRDLEAKWRFVFEVDYMAHIGGTSCP